VEHHRGAAAQLAARLGRLKTRGGAQ
jgi:hypothetical protein